MTEDVTQVRPDALLSCDIVMAGGVTSGIIDPGAVTMIVRRYSFQSIGGTSVGAIAAAVTAAAEYGRRTGTNPDAFDTVGGLAATLGEKAPDRHTRLFHLFIKKVMGALWAIIWLPWLLLLAATCAFILLSRDFCTVEVVCKILRFGSP